jgi:hypothetical protein
MAERRGDTAARCDTGRRSNTGARCRTAQVSAFLLGMLLMLAGCEPASGPVPIAYDRAACVHCRMLISTPAFAAQIRTADGEVLDFDDPGCLLAWRASRRTDVREAWYHHVREDRWLEESRTSFVSVTESPMGFGIGAVEQGAAESFDRAEAERRVALRAAREEESR